MSLQRLDKIIASQLNLSRREVKAAIRKGLAEVNGTAVRDPGAGVDPETDRIFFNGQAVSYQQYIYILMNKPKGVLSASRDRSRKTAVDLVPDSLKRNGLFPVGRLDRDTTGLLLITNDGNFAHNAISPRKNIVKSYFAELDGAVTQEMVRKFADGVVLADGSVCREARLTPLPGNTAEIRITEGKYHQIKRMFGTVGLGVNGLKRIAVGGLFLPEDLAEGECRELKEEEKNRLFSSGF